MSKEEGNVMQEVFSIGGGNPFEGSPLIEEPKEVVETPKAVKVEEIAGKPNVESEPKEEPKEVKKEANVKGSAAYIIAQSMIKDGVLPDDIELTPDMTASDLKAKLIESAKREASEDVRSEYESKYDPELLKTADFINKGIDPEDIKEVNIYKRLANANLSGEYEEDIKIKEFVITQMYNDLGLAENKIKKIVSDALDDDDGDAEFKEAIRHFKNKAVALEKSIQDEAEEREKLVAKEQEETKEKLRSLIKSGKIYGAQDEKSQKELDDFLFKSTETLVQDGKKYKVTGFYKKMLDYQKDLNSQLVFAQLLKTGFDLGVIEQKGGLKKASELDDLLSEVENLPIGGGKKSKNPEDFFSSLQEIM